MTKILKVFAVVTILLILLILTGWYTVPRWLPLIASHWLPQSVTLSLSQPQWKEGTLWLDNLSLKVKECEWVNVSGLSVGYTLHEHYWNIHATNMNSQSPCSEQLPVMQTQSTPFIHSGNIILYTFH